MSNQHRELTENEARRLREYVSAMVLNSQVTAEVAGLHPMDLYALNLLNLHGAASPGELAEHTALTTGAVTKLVDRLVRAGLVERSPDPTDRRRVVLRVVDETVTDAIGEQGSLFIPFARRMDELIGSFPEDQRATLFEFFARATTEIQQATTELQHAGRGQRGRSPHEEASSKPHRHAP